VGIGIQKTNAGIGIPASFILGWYRTQKNAGLRRFIPVPDKFLHR
jgi:hypothetical protein